MTRVQVNLVPHFQHVSASYIGHFAQAVKKPAGCETAVGPLQDFAPVRLWQITQPCSVRSSCSTHCRQPRAFPLLTSSLCVGPNRSHQAGMAPGIARGVAGLRETRMCNAHKFASAHISSWAFREVPCHADSADRNGVPLFSRTSTNWKPECRASVFCLDTPSKSF